MDVYSSLNIKKRKMKVWVNYRSGVYSGGMILVAANSAEEAHEAFHADERLDYM